MGPMIWDGSCAQLVAQDELHDVSHRLWSREGDGDGGA